MYLSVDLDYWGAWFTLGQAEVSSRRFLRRVAKLDCPIRVVVEHVEALKDLRGKRFGRIINVDAHDDLDTEAWAERHVATSADWVSYVRFRAKATYEWRYPLEDTPTPGLGLCAEGGNAWDPEQTEWLKLERRLGLARIPWSRVGRVIVVLSPRFTPAGHVLTGLADLVELRDLKLRGEAKTVYTKWHIMRAEHEERE